MSKYYQMNTGATTIIPGSVFDLDVIPPKGAFAIIRTPLMGKRDTMSNRSILEYLSKEDNQSDKIIKIKNRMRVRLERNKQKQ